MNETSNADTEQTIRMELEKAASLLSGARSLLTEGRSINLSAVEDRIRSITEAIAAAPPELAVTFKEHLTVLMEILDTLQTDLEGQHRALSDGLKSIKHKEAAGAYTPLEISSDAPQDVTPPSCGEEEG